MKEYKKFSYVRVVSRDFITDAFQLLRSFFGLRLVQYEKIIQNTIREMIREMEKEYNVEWHRFSINPLQKGTAMIILYGEGEKK